MKDYKLLLAGLILLLLILFIALFTWLWTNNRKNIDPLPIMAHQNEFTTTEGDDESMVADRVLYMQIEESLQEPFSDVIVSFESRYPYIQVLASYLPSNTLLTLSDTSTSRNTQSSESELAANIDVIIANDKLSQERLAPLQAALKTAQNKINQNEVNASSTDNLTKDETIDAEDSLAQTSSTEARTLTSFSYALKDEQALEGVILTDNTAAINFRNFLLSSTGQDILKKYDYYNIEGYRNSVSDLFSPTTSPKTGSNDTSVDVADALSNGGS